MLHALPAVSSSSREPPPTGTTGHEPPAATLDLLLAVLDRAKLAVVVTDVTGRALYMNASARATLGSPHGAMPAWLATAVPGLRHQLARQGQAVERVVHDDLALRVRPARWRGRGRSCSSSAWPRARSAARSSTISRAASA